MTYTCEIKHCKNNTFRYNKWYKTHKCPRTMTVPCHCKPPFKLFPFPSAKKQPQRRAEWIRIVRKHKGKVVDVVHNQKGVPIVKKAILAWEPNHNSRICSLHFVNELNTVPTLNIDPPGCREDTSEQAQRSQERKKRKRKHMEEKESKEKETDKTPEDNVDESTEDHGPAMKESDQTSADDNVDVMDDYSYNIPHQCTSICCRTTCPCKSCVKLVATSQS